MAPWYDYLCRSCGHVFDEIVRSAEAQPACPHCESEKTERLPSAPGGYQMNSGGASTRPKGAGSFRKGKA